MISPLAAAALLPFALFIGFWVSFSDLKFMRIPNQASLVMLAVWLKCDDSTCWNLEDILNTGLVGLT